MAGHNTLQFLLRKLRQYDTILRHWRSFPVPSPARQKYLASVFFLEILMNSQIHAPGGFALTALTAPVFQKHQNFNL